jgi:CRP-like cAMP-binding protein
VSTLVQSGAPRSHPSARHDTGCDRFVAKLSAASHLPSEDAEALAQLCANVRTIAAKHDVISEGDRPDHVHIVLEGWAARYKILPDGTRQITAFLIPGDFCDLHMTMLAQMDHGILALTRCRVAYVPHRLMEDLPLDRPRLGRALWRVTLVDEAVLRSWIVNLGRRDAAERIAHLFCELHARLALVGLVRDERFDLPLTQDVIADATGLTSVHVNRVLQKLRGDGLITLASGQLTILDVDGLRKLAGFDPNYLHRERLRQA